MLHFDERLDRIVEALQQINVNLEGLRVALQELSETTADHEERLRSIERWKYNLTPLLGALAFVLGALSSAVIGRVL
jgi:prefoldin subunit 5